MGANAYQPTYSGGLNRNIKRDPTPVTLLAAGSVQTASTTGAAVELGDAVDLLVTVTVTAASGTTPTMTVALEVSDDNVTWLPLGTIGANGFAPGGVITAPSNITGVSTVAVYCDGGLRYIRPRSVIGGTTPSFTFGITAQVYYAA